MMFNAAMHIFTLQVDMCVFDIAVNIYSTYLRSLNCSANLHPSLLCHCWNWNCNWNSNQDKELKTKSFLKMWIEPKPKLAMWNRIRRAVDCRNETPLIKVSVQWYDRHVQTASSELSVKLTLHLCLYPSTQRPVSPHTYIHTDSGDMLVVNTPVTCYCWHTDTRGSIHNSTLPPSSVTSEFKDLPTRTVHIPKDIPHPAHC